MRCVRIRFSKTGRMIYISHLDINRLMTRAVRRAKLPMWYTEGFNPHPYIAFALPLSLGQSSECEYMDIRIEGDMTNEQVKDALSAVMPEGVGIVSVADPVFNANEIASAGYAVTLEFADENEAESFCYSADALMSGDELMAEKMGKKGHRKVLKQVNLIEQIFGKEITLDGSKVILSLNLAAGNSVNLNPSLLIETLEKNIQISSKQQHIVREDLLTASGKSFC
ncbi:MAG: DUF2344 domain-containing protein [Clostridia bacterium]|nr:DUF2344 domain-containing protein [Clostridia bacterium]